MCQHVTLHVADAAKFIPSSVCISTRMSYVRPRLSLTARNIASPHLKGKRKGKWNPRRQQIAPPCLCQGRANTRFALPRDARKFNTLARTIGICQASWSGCHFAGATTFRHAPGPFSVS